MSQQRFTSRRLRSAVAASLLIGASLAGAARAWPSDVALTTAPLDQGLTVNGRPGVSAAEDGQGGSIVAWEDLGGGVRLQRLSPAGSPLWTAGGVLATVSPAPQFLPRVVSDGAGGAIVAWRQQIVEDTQENIYVQRVDASGARMWSETGLPLAAIPCYQDNVWLAADGVGGAFVSWSDGRVLPGPVGAHIFAQHLAADGSKLWAAGGVLLGLSEWQWPHLSRVVPDGAGGAIVAWLRESTIPAEDRSLMLQRLDAAGAPVWPAVGVDTGLCARDYGIAADGTGGAIVSCFDQLRVFVRRVDAPGALPWGPAGVAATTPPEDFMQLDPQVVSDGTGGAIVAWPDYRHGATEPDLYAQRFAPDGSRLWDPAGVPVTRAERSQGGFAMVSDGEGGALLAWADCRSHPLSECGDEVDLFAQRLDASGTPLWSADGAALSLAPGTQAYLDDRPSVALTRVAPGEAVVAWPDGRTGPCFMSSYGDCNVYAQQVLDTHEVPALPRAAVPILAALLLAGGVFAARAPLRSRAR